jgi:SAM-dependent methyltransferase
MAEHNQLYSFAGYYDILFRRDVRDDVHFLREAHRQYTGREATSVLEVACGPGYHARACALAGLRTAALDLRPEMIDYARDQAAAEQADVQWMVADMRDFQLDRRVDVALCMFDGLDALARDEDILDHLRRVASNLEPGGLYILDFTHLRDCSYTDYRGFQYQGQRDGVEVSLTWGAVGVTFDPVTALARIETEMRVRKNGQEEVIRDAAIERIFTPTEVNLLAALSGAFRLRGWFGAMNLDQPLDVSPSSTRMIAVYQREDSPR